VRLDGLGADEQLSGRLLVGRASRDQGDLELLRGQLLGGVRVALAQAFARRGELGARALGPGPSAEPVEHGQGLAQVPARLDAPMSAPVGEGHDRSGAACSGR
jgi:hypothetical protein